MRQCFFQNIAKIEASNQGGKHGLKNKQTKNLLQWKKQHSNEKQPLNPTESL